MTTTLTFTVGQSLGQRGNPVPHGWWTFSIRHGDRVIATGHDWFRTEQEARNAAQSYGLTEQKQETP